MLGIVIFEGVESKFGVLLSDCNGVTVGSPVSACRDARYGRGDRAIRSGEACIGEIARAGCPDQQVDIKPTGGNGPIGCNNDGNTGSIAFLDVVRATGICAADREQAVRGLVVGGNGKRVAVSPTYGKARRQVRLLGGKREYDSLGPLLLFIGQHGNIEAGGIGAGGQCHRAGNSEVCVCTFIRTGVAVNRDCHAISAARGNRYPRRHERNRIGCVDRKLGSIAGFSTRESYETIVGVDEEAVSCPRRVKPEGRRRSRRRQDDLD